jgi:NADH-quinone oxidoreductase subunit C
MSVAPAASPGPKGAPVLDPKLTALKAEIQPLLGPAAVFELQGTLPAFRVPAPEFHAAALKLKAAGFDYLLLLTATDYPAEQRFEMVYALSNFDDARELSLVTDLQRDAPSVETVSDLWAGAEWHEREVYDLFGIRFAGHPDLRRILLDDTWEGHPLRKDYVDKVHSVIKRPY